MLFTLDMHLQPTLSISGALQSSTNITNFHLLVDLPSYLLGLHLLILIAAIFVILVPLWLLPIQYCLKFYLLSPMFLYFEHDLLRFFNITLLTLFLGVICEKIYFLFKLINSIDQLILLELGELRQLLFLRFISLKILIVFIQMLGRILIQKLVTKQRSLLDLLPLSSIITLNGVFGSGDRLFNFLVNILDHSSKLLDQILFIFASEFIPFGVFFKHVFQKILVS